LIIIIAAGGLLWFDYLNVIDIKTIIAPVYRLLKLGNRSQPPLTPGEMLNMDAERLAVLIEAHDLRSAELDKVENDLATRQGEIEQMAAELEQRQKGLDEREKSLKAEEDAAAIQDRNVTQTALWLNNMPPDAAVNIIVTMDDQDILDLFRKVEQLAAESGSASLVSVWLMNGNMPPARAGELQRKMKERP
jgi:flagellar protein FlbB